MSNLVPFEQAPVPAYFSNLPDDSNLGGAAGPPSLSIRGKVWRVVVEGEETPILDQDGNPSPMVSLIVLDQLRNRSRVFYEGQFVPGESKAPTCASIDGVRPDATIAEPVAETCASCPNAVKGSKIGPSGYPTTACAPQKRLAVIPASDLAFSALLLRLPITSVYDKNSREENLKGWYAWDQVMDYARSKQVKHTAQVVIDAKFDHTAEFPKVLFRLKRWLTDAEWAAIHSRCTSEEVKDLLAGAEIVAPQVTPEQDEFVGGPPAIPVAATAAGAQARARGRAAATPAPAPAPAPAAAPAPVAAPAPAPAARTRSRSAAPAAAPAAPAAAPAPAPQAPASKGAGMSALMSAWDDD